jgi:hypothetical protein
MDVSINEGEVKIKDVHFNVDPKLWVHPLTPLNNNPL